MSPIIQLYTNLGKLLLFFWVYFYPKFKLTLTCLKSLFLSVVLISFGGPCDPECSEVGCDGPGPDHCNDCLHYYYKLKNNTR